MSFKKIILFSVVASTGFSVINAMANSQGIYIEGNAGYARQNYFSNESWDGISPSSAVGAVGTAYNNNSNVTGGFSGGVDAGYQFNQNFAIELGWFYLPSVNVMQTGSAGQTAAYLTSWALYLAGKYMMPLSWMNNTDAFFKLGAEYRTATLPTAAQTGYSTSTGNSSFVRPMFATGLDYNFNQEFLGIIQYAYFMGANNSFGSTTGAGPMGTVAANVFTLGLGYQFNV